MALGPISGLFIVGIAFLTTWDIIGRRAFRSPVVWAQEVSEYLLVISVFLALALSWREGRHVRVDILYARLNEKWRIRANLLFSFWAFLFTAALTWYGFIEVRDALTRHETSQTVMAIPTFPVKAFIPVGAFLLLLEIIRTSWKAARAQNPGGLARSPENSKSSEEN